MITDQSSFQEQRLKLGVIKTYADLQLSIIQLEEEKHLQEEMLRTKIAEIKNSFSPAAIVKDSLHRLATDSEVRLDVAKVGLNYGTDFIFGRVFGRRQSIPVYLVTKLAQKITGVLFSNYSSDIFSGIRKLLLPRSKPIEDTEDLFLTETEDKGA